MSDHLFASSIRSTQRFFNTATKCFEDADAGFAPKPEMFTVAQHIMHAGQTIRWFVDGAFSPDGMAHAFEEFEKEVRKVATLREARDAFNDACMHAIEKVQDTAKADFAEKIAGEIMAGEPRSAIFQAIADHTAHHRGALAVYARLLGKVPPMPYM